jgi:hypothetical protein
MKAGPAQNFYSQFPVGLLLTRNFIFFYGVDQPIGWRIHQSSASRHVFSAFSHTIKGSVSIWNTVVSS